MYEMMKSLGYKINIKKILEYKHNNFMKPYIDFLFKKKLYYKSICYSYILKKDIPDNENKIKSNILHTKGISNSYSQQYIDHNLFKETLLNNNKPKKIKFNTISVRKQKIITREIEKKNVEFLNDKRYIENINSNKPHTLYIE